MVSWKELALRGQTSLRIKIVVFLKDLVTLVDAFEVLLLRIFCFGALVYELAKTFVHR